MKNWLAKYANTRRQTNPEKVPPEPDEVSALGSILADHFVGGAKLANDRLVVARRLAYSLNHTDTTDAVPTGPTNTVSSSAVDHQQNRAQKAHHYGRKKNRYPRRGAGL
jgi:hypothetical protein